MTIFDYAVLVIMGLSIILSVMRGVVAEVFSILGWVTATYVAGCYSGQLIPMLPADIPSESLRVLVAFLVIFLATLLVTTLLSIALSTVFKKIRLGWLNRLLGTAFGIVRGLLVVCIVVFIAGLTEIPKDVRWKNAMFSAPIEALVINLLTWAPKSIAMQVKYD